MKRIICFIFVFFCLACDCMAQNVKFIQVTDVHLTQSNAQYLKQFVKDANEDFKDIDFIVFTGDNIDKANPQDLWLFLEIIKNLKVKPYVLIGNHDLFKSRGVTNKNYMYLVRKRLGLYHSNKANYVFKKNGFVFVTMNGVKEVIPSPNGYFRQEELVWLDKTLSKYANKKVVILQHFPLLETQVKNHNLYRKEDYMDILKKHNNVISIVSGHYHENREENKDGIYHIITKNFSNNTYYKIIEIDTKDDMIFTHLINNSENEN